MAIKVKKKGHVKQKNIKKKGEMIRAGKVGLAAQFITRSAALRKLQVSLADFRKLCILRGVYPRDPRKKLKGSEKVYYHLKDISFLERDPLLEKIADLKVFKKRVKKTIGRRQLLKARKMEKYGTPEYELSHIIRQRYPTFADALRDLDDAVCTVAMFQCLTGDEELNFKPRMIQEASVLYDQFLLYACRTGRISKCFASIKGFYFQADMPERAAVTWLQPHRFTQVFPSEVDPKVLSTFLEWHGTLLKFALYRLYSLEGWAYPPKLEADVFGKKKAPLPATPMGSMVCKYDLANLKRNVVESDMGEAELKPQEKVFAGLTFYLSVEVPYVPLYLLIISGGGKVVCTASDPSVTHFICDRPSLKAVQNFLGLGSEEVNAEFLQPQWVFDSFNEGITLPAKDYSCGVPLPPHLSPFINDSVEGYIPRQRELLDRLVAERKAMGEGVVVEVAKKLGDDAEAQMEEALTEEQMLREIEMEKKGEIIKQKAEEQQSVTKASKKKLQEEEERRKEERERQVSMMPKKQQRLLTKLERGKAKQARIATKLQKRKDKQIQDEQI